jgi:hypothetical protein
MRAAYIAITAILLGILARNAQPRGENSQLEADAQRKQIARRCTTDARRLPELIYGSKPVESCSTGGITKRSWNSLSLRWREPRA